jgi:Na+-driven multidrug efflux pump
MVFVALRRADTTLVQNLISGVRVPVLLFIGALGTIGILYALNIAFIFSLVFGTYYLINYGFSLKPTFDIVSLKKIFSYSIGNFVSIIISILPNSILPILIINLLGAEETAYYFVAYSFYSLVYMIPFGVSTSLFVEGSNRLPLKENIKKSMKFIMVLLLPVILFVVLFGDKLLLIFSEEYSIQSFDLLRLLAISTFFYSFVMIFASMMMVQKKLKIMNVFTCTNAFLIIVLGYVFLQQFGLIGLGYAWLAANVITGTLACYLIIKEKDKDV